MNGFLKSYTVTSCCLSEKQRKVLMSKPTDVYVWGNGIQINASLNYNNYYPKKIKNFSGKNDPQIIMVKFGDFHEAYLDKKGKIHICSKHKLPSMKLDGQDDWIREGMITLEIKGRKVEDIAFTQNRLFVLTNKGEVYVWVINYELPEEKDGPKGDFFDKKPEEFDVEIIKEPILIQELKNIVEIASGTDHFLARDKNGDVWAMGDDTFGQWGQYSDNRPEIPPFKERRYRRPIKVLLPWKAEKIASGYRHSFAISDAGELYGWGYNNQQQLSHSEEFATETSQKHVMFEPVKITREIETK
jgi:alpha-tubulin suppressor-like RCC1 family protein